MPLKTDDLIHMLAEDAPAPPMRIGRAMTLALLLSTAISIVLLLCTIGMRRDIGAAIETARVMFKIGVTLVLAAVACGIVLRIGRPGAPLRVASP